jgi:HEAT repeat protein
MKTPAAVLDLINIFQDPDPTVRTAASHALVQIGTDALLPLIKALSTSDEQTARMIHTTLVSMGDEAARALVENIHILQGIGYERAGYVLHTMGVGIIPILIDAYETSDLTTVRFIEGLFESFGRAAIQPLIMGLEHDNEEVRARIAAYLIILGDQVVGELLSSCGQDEDWLRELKFYIISEIGKPALDPLYQALKDPNPSPLPWRKRPFGIWRVSHYAPYIRPYDQDLEIRKVSEHALIRIGEPVVSHLLDEISVRRESDREPIISVIQHIGEPAIPYLIANLNRSKGERSKQMVHILSTMGAITIPYLINAVQEEGDTSALRDAFLSMGRIAFPFLEEASERERGKVAVFALNLLKQIDPVRSIEPMITALSHPDQEVRETALENLVNFGEMAIPRLIQVLGSGNEQAGALAKTALIQSGELAIPHLVDSLSDPMGPEKELLLEILGENEAAAVPYLVPFMMPGKPGHDEAMVLINGMGADATAHFSKHSLMLALT